MRNRTVTHVAATLAATACFGLTPQSGGPRKVLIDLGDIELGVAPAFADDGGDGGGDGGDGGDGADGASDDGAAASGDTDDDDDDDSDDDGGSDVDSNAEGIGVAAQMGAMDVGIGLNDASTIGQAAQDAASAALNGGKSTDQAAEAGIGAAIGAADALGLGGSAVAGAIAASVGDVAGLGTDI
jgi:hypothetical protein